MSCTSSFNICVSMWHLHTVMFKKYGPNTISTLNLSFLSVPTIFSSLHLFFYYNTCLPRYGYFKAKNSIWARLGEHYCMQSQFNYYKFIISNNNCLDFGVKVSPVYKIWKNCHCFFFKLSESQENVVYKLRHL